MVNQYLPPVQLAIPPAGITTISQQVPRKTRIPNRAIALRIFA